jgi:hypothetical protein
MTDLLFLRWSSYQNGVLTITASKTRKTTGKVIEFEGEDIKSVMRTLWHMTNFHIREYVFVSREGIPYIRSDKIASGFNSAWQRWMKKVNEAHGFKFSERQLRVKVGSDQDSVEAAAEHLGNAPAVARKHYRAKPVRIKSRD